MFVFKLSVIPSPIRPICYKPHNLEKLIMRTFASTSSGIATSAAVANTFALSFPVRRSLALDSKRRSTLLLLRGGEALMSIPRAQLRISAHVETSRIKLIDTCFIGHHNFLLVSSPYSFVAASSSEEEERERRKKSAAAAISEPSSSSSSSPHPSSSVPVGGLVADMGHESSNNDVACACYHRDGVNSSSPSPLLSSSGKKQLTQQKSKFLTLPTILTLGRVAAVPILIATFYTNSWWGTAVTTTLFIAAAITDWLDGYIARKMQLGTTFGAFLDPVADKLMVAATLVLLCSRPLESPVFGDFPWLFPVPSIAIIGREITMSAVREWAAAQNGKLLEAVAVNNLGKWKTATQMTALTILLASRDSRLAGSEALVASGVVLLYISSGLAVWSLVVYMKKIGKVLLR